MRKECSSDVSSRFFWGARCVTAQKTAARETNYTAEYLLFYAVLSPYKQINSASVRAWASSKTT